MHITAEIFQEICIESFYKMHIIDINLHIKYSIFLLHKQQNPDNMHSCSCEQGIMTKEGLYMQTPLSFKSTSGHTILDIIQYTHVLKHLTPHKYEVSICLKF